MRRLYHLNLQVTLRAPWLVQGSDPGRLGLDATQLRGPDGRLRVLPGSLLVGRLRESWTELAGLTDAPRVADWLGPTRLADQADASREPQRTRLFVDDLFEVAAPSADVLSPANRLKMNATSGSGEEGMLQFIEQREAPGTDVTFRGLWRAWLDGSEARDLPRWIAKGLRWHTQLGALRSIGFGEVIDAAARAELADAGDAASATATFAAGHAQWPRGLTLRFSQPLAVSNRRVNGNLFVSGDVVPGAALKGALATMIKSRGNTVPQWFDDLRITHALPSTGARRPAPLPLNLVADHDGQVWELRSDTAAFRGGKALAFIPDWKAEPLRAARARQGWGRTRTHLRVRTAIESKRAAEGALFAYECRLADKNIDASDGPTTTCWTATLDLPGGTADQWQEFASLLSGCVLGPIGKTDAFARVDLNPALEPVWSSSVTASRGSELPVLLMTDGLLFPGSWVEGHTSTAAVDLLDVYRRSFAAIAEATLPGSAHALRLSRVFAQQRLAGGDYLNRRRRPSQAGPYQPYVLTVAGSMFVFAVEDEGRAAELLHRWQAHGLPLGREVAQEHGGDWTSNPYIAQNGYGEVCVNPQHGFEGI